ncbi:hypothetical protein NC651_003345 [Populus alba x Populus x berolinensis]|nr:hypothetical protein NC651_003345 [Populus alba x Populus x berolinensis]
MLSISCSFVIEYAFRSCLLSDSCICGVYFFRARSVGSKVT